MKLIEEARQAWRLWSVRLAAVAGVLAGYLAAYPAQVQQLVDYVPEQWRPAASVLIGFTVFGLPTVLRLIAQPAKENSDG